MSSFMSFSNFGSSFSFAMVWRLTQSLLVAGKMPRPLSRSRVSGNALHPNLEMVEGFSRNVRGPERTPFGVPVEFHSLPGTPVSEQDVLAFVVPSAIDFLEVEHLGVELDRPLQVRDSNADIADPEVGHGPVENESTQESIENPSRALADRSIARENHGTDHTQSCLTAKPPTHHRRVLVWLWRLVAGGWKPRPFGRSSCTPPPSTSSATTALRSPVFWAGFRLEAFCRF